MRRAASVIGRGDQPSPDRLPPSGCRRRSAARILGIQRQLAQQRDVEVGRHLLHRRRCRISPLRGHSSEQTWVLMFSMTPSTGTDTLRNIASPLRASSSRDVLRRGDDHSTTDRYLLRQRQLDIAGARRHIDDQVVEIVPVSSAAAADSGPMSPSGRATPSAGPDRPGSRST